MKWLFSVRLRQLLATGLGLFVLLAVLDELENTEVTTHKVQPETRSYVASVVQPKAEPHMPTLDKLAVLEAAKLVELTSDVAGRIVDSSPSYRRGRVLPAQEWLLQVDPLPYEAQVAAARVALMNANMALKNARAQYAHDSLMVQTANADLEYYQLQYQQAQQDLKRSRIALPFSGELVDIRTHVGEHITVGQSIASVLPRDGQEIRVVVSVQEFDSLAQPLLQHPVTITDLNGNVVGKAHIQGVSQYSEQLQRQLYMTLDGQHSLITGQHVRAQLPLKPWSRVYSVPESSLTAQHEIWFSDKHQRVQKQRLHTFIVQNKRVYFSWPATSHPQTLDNVLAYPRDSLAQGMSIEARPVRVETTTLSQEAAL